MMRVLVLSGFGINCEEETAAAFRLAGVESVAIHHVNDLFEERVNLDSFDIFVLPGGFSFGDDLGSGRMLAHTLRYRRTFSGRLFFEDLTGNFLKKGGIILGICNGFQVLVQCGLLPNTQGVFAQEATLTHNASLKFESRWVRLAADPASLAPAIAGINIMNVPVRHGEGRLLFANDTIRQQVQEQHLVPFRYIDGTGNPTLEYPANPNHSEEAVAALCDPSRQIFGLMPHPEACLALVNHPDWSERVRAGANAGDSGEGLVFFQNIVSQAFQIKKNRSHK